MRFASGTALLRHSFIRLGFVPGWLGLLAETERTEVFNHLRAALGAQAAKHGELELSVPMAYVEARGAVIRRAS